MKDSYRVVLPSGRALGFYTRISEARRAASACPLKTRIEWWNGNEWVPVEEGGKE